MNLTHSLVLVSNHSTEGSQGNPWKHLIRRCVYGLENLHITVQNGRTAFAAITKREAHYSDLLQYQIQEQWVHKVISIN